MLESQDMPHVKLSALALHQYILYYTHTKTTRSPVAPLRLSHLLGYKLPWAKKTTSSDAWSGIHRGSSGVL